MDGLLGWHLAMAGSIALTAAVIAVVALWVRRTN